MSIETWLSTIPIGGSVPRRFDSAGLIQFGIEKRLYNVDPAEIYEQYVESMVAGAAPPTPLTRTADRGGHHGDGNDDHPLLSTFFKCIDCSKCVAQRQIACDDMRAPVLRVKHTIRDDHKRPRKVFPLPTGA